MKQRMQGMVIGFLVSVLFLSGITVWAATGTQNVSITYRDIKLQIDGVPLTPRDANGNVVEPFIYNGTTYLPVRAVGEAFGKAVEWDGNTNTVYVGSKPGGTSFIKAVPPYDVSSSNRVKTESNVTMGGTVYYDALTFNDSGFALHNLNGQYTRISGYLGHVNGTGVGGSMTITFYGDGRILDSYELDAQQLPQHISINVTGVLQLKIESKSMGPVYGTGKYAFAGIIE